MDIQKAMELLEGAIAKAPDDAANAPYYLLLGRLKKEYESYQDAYGGSEERTKQNIEEFRKYAAARPKEYFRDEVSDTFLYNGAQFKELVKRHPSDPAAVEAAYEITNLSQGGECEGSIVCAISAGFAPVQGFLLKYPDSPHTVEAAKRADDAFRKILWEERWDTEAGTITDATQENDDYDPVEFKKLVDQYEELAEKLAPQFRPRIYETVAFYDARLRETPHSRALYEKILKQFPDYQNTAEVRQKLAALR